MFGDMAMESMTDNIYDDTCWMCDGTGKIKEEEKEDYDSASWD